MKNFIDNLQELNEILDQIENVKEDTTTKELEKLIKRSKQIEKKVIKYERKISEHQNI